MLIQTPAWLIGTEARPAKIRSDFEAYIEAQTDLSVESLQDEADNHWHLLRWQMDGAGEEEIGIEMERWWHSQIRRFQSRLYEERRRDRERLLRRRLRRERRRRIDAEHRQGELEIELQQTRDALAGEREHLSFLIEQWNCRTCNGPWNY